MSQVALSLALLVGTALSVRNLTHLLSVDDHLDLDRLLTIATDAPGRDVRLWQPAMGQALDGLRQLPGVAAASVADFLPLRGGRRLPLVRPGADRDDTRPTALRQAVGSAFFDTLGLALVRGRSFDDSEFSRGEPVAVISERLARMLWPASDPIGQQIRFAAGEDDASHTILGVAADLSNWDLSGVPLPAVYVPITRGASGHPTYVVRAALQPDDVAAPAIEAITSAGVEVGLGGPVLLSDVQRTAFFRQAGMTRLFRVVGALSLVLTFIGLFALLSYQVAQRTAELGIRMALGASRAQVLVLVMRQAMVLGGAGLVLGVPAAYATTRVLRRVLFQVDPDPVLLASLAAVIGGVALLAGWAPAWRAASIDPAQALR